MLEIEKQGAVEIITPQVPINKDNAEKLINAVTTRSTGGQPMVVIDLSHVPLIDSVGMEALIDVHQHLRNAAGSLKLAALTPLCQDIFRVTGLNERFEIFQDANLAVRSFVR